MRAAASIAMYQIFAGQVMGIFINNVETVALGTGFLRARVLATPLMFLGFFHVHLFNGFGKGGRALFLGVMRWLAFNIPMLLLLNTLFGMYGIVWSQVTADTLTVILSLWVYLRYERRTFVKVPQETNNFAALIRRNLEAIAILDLLPDKKVDFIMLT